MDDNGNRVEISQNGTVSEDGRSYDWHDVSKDEFEATADALADQDDAPAPVSVDPDEVARDMADLGIDSARVGDDQIPDEDEFDSGLDIRRAPGGLGRPRAAAHR